MDKNNLLVSEVPITHPLLSFNWTELPQLPNGTSNAQSVLYNGQLYVGGGARKAVLYMLAHGNWISIDTPTYCYGLMIFMDHLVLVGGRERTSNSATNKVWVMQSRGKAGGVEWKEDAAIPPMLTSRSGVAAVGYNELLLVAGGQDENQKLTDVVELYNSKSGQWLVTTSLPQPCSDMSCTVMGNQIVFAGGEGQGREIYVTSIDQIVLPIQWERLADTPMEYASISSINGVLVAIGGRTGSSTVSAAMFGFSAHTRSWHHFFNLPVQLQSICTTLTPMEHVMAIGGQTDSGLSSRIFKLNVQDEAALVLSNIILKGVQSGLLAPVERALTIVKEHSHSSQPHGGLLLDFLAHSSSSNVSTEHSPLMIACDNEDTTMVVVLLENGASPSYKNKDDVTALHIACSKDNLKLVHRLLNIDSGLTEHATKLLRMIDKEGQTVFHYACDSYFGIETLKWLLQFNALQDFVNKSNNTGYTPLLTACRNANVAAVEVLITHDQVDTAVCDENNQGPLHLAAMNDSSSIVELLLSKGCPCDTQDIEGNTPLHIAYKKSSSYVISILTQVDDGRIELIINKAGQHPADIEPDDIIPPEILKKGAKAVQVYLKALMSGKIRIPQCNLFVLGEERVGKTSLFRLLVNLPFNPDQESTRGIDNTIVDTVDTRSVGIKDWAEKDRHTVQQYLDKQFVEGVIGALPSDFFALSNSPTPTVTEFELQEELSKLKPEIQQIFITKKNPLPLVKSLQTRPNFEVHPQTRFEKKTVNDYVDPLTSIQSTQQPIVVPKISSRYAKLIDQQLTGATASKERTEPVLILNALDFAGQKQYRPMHHCFLARRGIYLVVFNLQHVVQYLKQKSLPSVPSDVKVSNPFEEIRYWLHSIHAHTLPTVPGNKDKPLRNVCLVGTHLAPFDTSKGKHIEIKPNELKKINDLLIKEMFSDERCSSHLHLMGPNGDQIFIAVENSIEDRETSGAKALQVEINILSKKLPFLGEEYPITWLRFDAELTRMKETLKQKMSSLVVKVEVILKIATQCGITDPDGQHLALEFFHETGKILCLKFLPPLFISQEEHAELEEQVLLDPTWLIHIMMKVVELNYRSTIQGRHLNQLRETGIASSDLLKEAWSEYLRDPIQKSFRQMCLMLQAEALIHPIRIIPKSVVEQFLCESDPNLKIEPYTHPNSEATSTDEEVEYLIPGKLPGKIREEPVKSSWWITFYFDFQRFLPDEIYHKLLCMMLDESDIQKKKWFSRPYLSRSLCSFKDIDDCDWCIEMESEYHRLKISVLSSTSDRRSPTYFIIIMHKYLQRICTLTDLQGLRYVGGPVLNPCVKCKKTKIIEYVSYFEGEDLPSKSECPQCHKIYDVDQLLLASQVNDQSFGTTDRLWEHRWQTDYSNPRYELHRHQGLMITKEPQGQHKEFGEKVSFAVIAKGIGNLSYQWIKDGRDIDISTYPCCKGVTTSTLSIVCALPLYEGHYKCVVRNDFHKVESQTARLQVVRISGPKLTVEEIELISRILSEEDVLVQLNQFGIKLEDGNLIIEEVHNVLSSLGVADSVVKNLNSALDNLKHYQAYELALQQGTKLSIRYLKFLFYGPPQVGKTSARRRLVGEILNLKSEQNHVNVSTGTAESSSVIVQRVDDKLVTSTAMVMQHKWMSIKGLNETNDQTDLNYELNLLYKFIYEHSLAYKTKSEQPLHVKPVTQTDYNLAQSDAEVNSNTVTTVSEFNNYTEDNSSSASDTHNKQLEVQQRHSTTPVSKSAGTVKVMQTLDPNWKQNIEVAFTAFTKVLRSENRDEYLNALLEGTSLINMVDTGGQTAFLEMLPLLTVGPAMYLVFMNLMQELKNRYYIQYATKDHGVIPLSTSSYTIQEVIFQILSSISAFSRFEGSQSFPQSSQATLLVGTFKDEFLASGGNLVEKDKAVQMELKQVLQNDSGLLCRASEDPKSLVLAIDNMTGDEHEVETMRRRLEAIIENNFKKYEIPAAWLMFNIFLRKLGMRIMSLTQCRDIAKRLHVNDISNALWFFHHIVGSLMYFPTVKELKDIVICDPQVLFDSITSVITQSFVTASLLDNTEREEFAASGQFSYKDIEKVVRESTEVDDHLPPDKLMKLLEHLNIIAPIATPESHSKAPMLYFFPAILRCATNEQLQNFEQSKETNDPLPLMIHFKFGFVPMGLFCATIASLVSQIYSEKLGWVFKTVDHKSLYKNMLTFHTGDAYDITLISRPKRFEVHLTQTAAGSLEGSQTTEQCSACISVLETICATLDRVVSKIKHLNMATSTQEPIYQLGFKCPLHNHSDSDDLLLNEAHNNTSAVSRSPKDLWYGFLEDKSCFQCLNSEGRLSKNEVFNPKFLNCLSWFGISDHNSLSLLLIDEHPKSQSKVYGDEVFFEIKTIVTGHRIKMEPLKFQWFKDDTEITLETHPYCRGAHESTLHINSLLAQYEGNYKCKVSSQQDGNVVYSNEATLKISTPLSWLLEKYFREHDSTSQSILPPDFNTPQNQLLPLVPPSINVVNCKGRLLMGPDEVIAINIPSGAVADDDTIHIRIQSFVPAQDDTIVLPQGLKLFSPIYQISASGYKFQKTVELSMLHYAKLVSRKDVSGLVFLHSTDKTPPYKFRILEGGEFDFDTCRGNIHLETFCKVAPAGPVGVVEEYGVFLIQPIPELNSKCMCAMFSASYRHNAYVKHLEEEMKTKFSAIEAFHSAFEHVELAEGSHEFELIIPHKEVEKQGYAINILGHNSAKIPVKHIPPRPPQESAASAGYPIPFPVPHRLLHVKLLPNCENVKDLECNLKVSGIKGDEKVFVLRAKSPVTVKPETEPQAAGNSKFVDGSDWAEITWYLDKLNRSHIERLGGLLGLNIFKLEKMQDLPSDMVKAWLRQEDKVKERCRDGLTWEVLVKALDRIGQRGVADEIRKDKRV